MNYGQLQSAVLRLLDEYSSRGVEQAKIKTADMRIKIPDATNQILMDLAITTGKLHKEWTIVNFPINTIASDDNSTIKNHLPGVDDIITTRNGARSYYLEVSGHYHIFIEEQIGGANGEWVPLVELRPDEGDEPDSFVSLRGLIEPEGANNAVRIRLTGEFVYPYRNYTLYPYTFPSPDDVQPHTPWVEKPLPSDWLKMRDVMIRGNRQLQWDSFHEYRETPTHFYYKRFVTGEILVNYYRKPRPVIVDDPRNPTEEELAQMLDAMPDAVQAAPFGVAGTIMAGDEMDVSGYLLNLYETRKFQLIQNDGSFGIQEITSVTGW